MARAATTTDAFNAVAEPRRRQILDLLAAGELPVGDLADQLGIAQPQASKHLRVLREVDLVRVRDQGRHRLYRINTAPLKPLFDWLSRYEQSWNARFDRLDDVLDDLREDELKEAEQHHDDHQGHGEGHPPRRQPDPDHP